jgi:hypothetical protein
VNIWNAAARGALPLAAALLLGAAGMTGAAATPITTDTPSAAPGNAQGPAPFRFFGGGGSHVQQVYESQLFGNFGGARSISALAFRTFAGASPNAFFGNQLTISDVRISLSTTGRGDETGNTLGSSFADNVGADQMLVYSGALTLTTTSPGSFDYIVTLQNAFTYDPSLGNLLLEVLIPTSATVGGNGILGFLTFDQANTLNDGIFSVVNTTDGGAASGTPDTAGAITRFISNEVAVPEPLSLAVFGAGLMGLGLARRRRTSVR